MTSASKYTILCRRPRKTDIPVNNAGVMGCGGAAYAASKTAITGQSIVTDFGSTL